MQKAKNRNNQPLVLQCQWMEGTMGPHLLRIRSGEEEEMAGSKRRRRRTQMLIEGAQRHEARSERITGENNN